MKRATWLMAGAAALAGAGMAAGAAQAQNNLAYIGTALFGEEEVGHKGAGEDATGDFSAELDLKAGRMCYMLEIQGLEGFTAAHLHEGRKGANGPPVVTLQLLGDDGEDVCVDVDPELLKKIARREDAYYVNVHTEAFPEGAIRGQLND